MDTLFHNAPNVDEFACENMASSFDSSFDGLRRMMCGFYGLDLIVPFLDKNFELCMSINQNEKIGKIEKRILREALKDISHEILWRQG